MPKEFSLEEHYDAYPRLEDAFRRALDVSLNPRGPELLYELIADLRLPSGASVVDVGCGEGKQALRLAEHFGFIVRGFDPVKRHIQLANESLAAATERIPDLQGRLRFELGTAEALPVEDASVDLVWCRDVLVHVWARQGIRRVPEGHERERSSPRVPELIRNRQAGAAGGRMAMEGDGHRADER